MSTGVTAIVVNWNGAALLGSCLASLAAQTHPDVQIVVVDNGSTDRSQSVAGEYDVDWVQLAGNVGLAPAMNIGATRARHGDLLFLNNDMELAPDFVAKLVGCKQAHEDLGAVDAVQRDGRTGDIVHASTRLRRALRAGLLPGWDLRFEPASEDGPTVYASGANTFVARDVFTALGGWDDHFFAGWEDVDLGWRLWLRGLPVVLAVSAVSDHSVGSSSTSGEGHAIRSEAAMHGPLLFSLKHAPRLVLALTFARFLIGFVFAAVRLDAPALRRRRRVAASIRREARSALQWRRSEYKANATSPARHWRAMRAIGSRV